MTAIEILRERDESDKLTEITILESNKTNTGGGLAYGKQTANNEHVINIQAERMSPFPFDRNDFVEWLYYEHDDIYYNSQDAVPRRIFQEYLNMRLQEAIDRNPSVTVTKKTGRAIDAKKHETGIQITLKGGRKLNAAHVVLATGHTTPVIPPFIKTVQDNERVLSSQWGVGGRKFMREMDRDATVFIVGTSMSAFDAVVSLLKRGHKGKIVMCSRHGYTHPTYEQGRIPPPVDIRKPPILDNLKKISETVSEQDVVDHFERGIKEEWFNLTRQNRLNGEQILNNWEKHVPEAIEKLKASGVRLSTIAKLLKDHRSLIDTNRIGVSRVIGETVYQAMLDGQVEVWSADIQAMYSNYSRAVNENFSSVSVEYMMTTPDGSNYRNQRDFDYVISSLGQEMDYSKVTEPLWQNLIERGEVTPHWTNLGITVGHEGQIVNGNGEENNSITAIGTMRAGDTITTRRAYGEKAGSGGRLGPPAFSVVALKDHFNETARHVIDQVNFVNLSQNNPSSEPEHTESQERTVRNASELRRIFMDRDAPASARRRLRLHKRLNQIARQHRNVEEIPPKP